MTIVPSQKPLRLSESFDQIVTVHHPLETSPNQQPQEVEPVESMEGNVKEMEQSTSFPFQDVGRIVHTNTHTHTHTHTNLMSFSSVSIPYTSTLLQWKEAGFLVVQ